MHVGAFLVGKFFKHAAPFGKETRREIIEDVGRQHLAPLLKKQRAALREELETLRASTSDIPQDRLTLKKLAKKSRKAEKKVDKMTKKLNDVRKAAGIE